MTKGSLEKDGFHAVGGSNLPRSGKLRGCLNAQDDALDIYFPCGLSDATGADEYEPDSLHPLLGYGVEGASRVFDGLLAHDADRRLQPALATEVALETDPDARRLLKKHAVDESRHSLLYLALLDLTFADGVDLALG